MSQTKQRQEELTPATILQLLKEGNQRFVGGKLIEKDLMNEVKETSSGQYPHTVVLGCIDSRVNPEQIFDVGIGDIFDTRIAGSVISKDVLGSLEFSCKLAGSKVILVLGHTNCGAVTAACKGDKCGHVTQLLAKIQPAVQKVAPTVTDITTSESVNKVVRENVLKSIKDIQEGSDILKKLEDENKIEIIGGVYDIQTGKVEFI